MYYVYLLQCSDGTYYTGVTNDLEKRLIQHKSGYDPGSYTFSRRPLELKWYGQFTDVRYAIEKEKQIKKWSKAKKEALINDDWDRIQELAKKVFKKKVSE